ncbi:hypothetical protein D3C71_2054540 [compost metagenome]
MLFYTAGNIRQLVSHNLVSVFRDLDEPADCIADGLLPGPFEFPLHPVTPDTGGGSELEGESHTELILGMVHNSLRSVHCPFHLAVHR